MHIYLNGIYAHIYMVCNYCTICSNGLRLKDEHFCIYCAAPRVVRLEN